MQFSISRENLLKPLQQVCGVLSNRPNIPVLNNVLLQIEDNRLTITGTDLELNYLVKLSFHHLLKMALLPFQQKNS